MLANEVAGLHTWRHLGKPQNKRTCSSAHRLIYLQFRSRDRSNRSGRGQVEHNVLEGLPINQYREVEITIGPNTIESKQLDKDDWPDPPMPRDSHLLPDHSQQILARARSGRIYKPPAPPEEDKEAMDEEEEHKEVRQGFTVKKWIKVPRHLEEAEPEYLAKRRKGLPSQYSLNGVTITQPTPMRETKVKKTDADGNVNVYKVLVPEGQAVEGEVQLAEAVTDAAVPAPGTVVEGVGVVNAEGVVVANDLLQQTPPRRRPPPPKKKKKSGPGRGKKKVLFVEGSTEQGTPISSTGSELLTVPRTKHEESVEPSEGGDTPMPDAADEDEGSVEEGSDEEDQEDHEMVAHSPTSTNLIPIPATSVEPAQHVHAELTETETETVGPLQVQKALSPAATQADVSEDTSAPEPDMVAAEDVGQPSAQPVDAETLHRHTPGSPEPPSSTATHSRRNSQNQTAPSLPSRSTSISEPTLTKEIPVPSTIDKQSLPTTDNVDPPEAPMDTRSPDGEPDLLGSLERQLERDSGSMGAT